MSYSDYFENTKLVIGLKIVLIVLLLLSGFVLKAKDDSKINPNIINPICQKRGHVGYDTIPMIIESTPFIWDVRDTVFRVTPSRIEFHFRCERCGEIIVYRPMAKFEMLMIKQKEVWINVYHK